MALTKLITAAEIITIAFEDNEFDPDLINDTVILGCQQTYFQPELAEYYDELISQKSADTLTEANQLILTDFLTRSLAYYVKSVVVVDRSFPLTPAGVQQIQTDFTNPGSTSVVFHQKNISLRFAEDFRRQMIDYLNHEDNIDNYPTYRDRTQKSPTSALSRFGIGIDRTKLR